MESATNFLKEHWQDILNVVGFMIALFGIYQTWLQSKKAATAAEAAEAAARFATKESNRAFQNFAIAFVHRYFHEARTCVHSLAWEKAADRLDDLADHLAQLSPDNMEWKNITTETRRWAITHRRMNPKDPVTFSQEKWDGYCKRLQAKIDLALRPYRPEV